MAENFGEDHRQDSEEERLNLCFKLLKEKLDQLKKQRTNLQEMYDQMMKYHEAEPILAIRQSMEATACSAVKNANAINVDALKFVSMAVNSASSSSSGSHVLHISHTNVIKDQIAEHILFFSEFLQTILANGTGDETRLPQDEQLTIPDYNEVLQERIRVIFMITEKMTEARQMLSEIDLKVPEIRRESSGHNENRVDPTSGHRATIPTEVRTTHDDQQVNYRSLCLVISPIAMFFLGLVILIWAVYLVHFH